VNELLYYAALCQPLAPAAQNSLRSLQVFIPATRSRLGHSSAARENILRMLLAGNVLPGKDA